MHMAVNKPGDCVPSSSIEGLLRLQGRCLRGHDPACFDADRTWLNLPGIEIDDLNVFNQQI